MEFIPTNKICESEYDEPPVLLRMENNNTSDSYNDCDLNDDSPPSLFTDIEFVSINKDFQNSEILSEIDSNKSKSSKIGILGEKKVDLEKIDGVIDSMITEFFDLKSEREKGLELETSLVSETVEGMRKELQNQLSEEKLSLVSDTSISFQKQNGVEGELCGKMVLEEDFSDMGLSAVTEEVNKIKKLESENITNMEKFSHENVSSSERKRKLSCILENVKDSTLSKEKYVEKKLIVSSDSHSQDSPLSISSETNGRNKIMNKKRNSQGHRKNAQVELTLELNDKIMQTIPESLKDSMDDNICLSSKNSSNHKKMEAEIIMEPINTNHSEEGKQIETENGDSTKDKTEHNVENSFNCTQHSNPFEIIVPLIGKSIFSSVGLKPFARRYDLARERNRLRAKHPDASIPMMSYEEFRQKRDARTPDEVEKEMKMKKFRAMRVAAYLTKIAIKILKELLKDEPSEEYIIKYFHRFQSVSSSPLSLIYAPHFVHTVMFCRGCIDFSPRLRKIADDCYNDCHAMFPIPFGYNFETVYASELKKNLPDEYEGISDIIPEYGDYDCPSSDSDDSAFYDDNDNSNETGN